MCDQIKDLTIHHFIAESKNKYFTYAKENLSINECLVVLDFAENYSSIAQDVFQDFHWNSSQTTIHPFVIYYLNSEKSSTDQLDHLSIVRTSDHLQLDTVSVYSFQKVVMKYLQIKLPFIMKVTYFSDG